MTEPLSTAQVAAILKLHPNMVRNYADRGALRVVRDAKGQRQFDADDVARFKANRKAWLTPKLCLFGCGTSIPQHRLFCDGDACRKRRQRIRWHKHQAKPEEP